MIGWVEKVGGEGVLLECRQGVDMVQCVSCGCVDSVG